MALQLPAEPREGVPLSAAWGRQVIRYLRAMTLRSSPTVRVNTTGAGTVLEGARQSRLPSPEPTHPFKVTDVSDDEGPKIAIEPGYVQNFGVLTPTIDGESMTTRPKVSVPTNDFIIYLKVEVDTSGHGVSAEIHIADSTEEDTGLPESDDTYGYCALAFGYWIDEDESEATPPVLSLQQVVSFSLGHQKCGTVTHNFWAQ